MVYIGVDLGGTNIAAGVVSAGGALMYKESVPTLASRGRDAVISDIIRLCQGLAGRTDEKIGSVGVGSPGACDSRRGVIRYNYNLGFRDVFICDEIGRELGVSSFLENDGNCAALGESKGGAAQGFDSSVTITLGTGVGGGIIIDGCILTGAFGSAGEVGHHVISRGGMRCTCGSMGCWEVYASVPALVRQAREAAEKNPKTAMMDIAGGDICNITSPVVFEAMAQGDVAAAGVVEQYARYVACGLANIINILQPHIVVIGGGLSAQGERLLEPVIRYTAEDVFGGVLNTQIVVSALGNDAGIIGAAMLETAQCKKYG